jgi:hypothetical protein
VILLNGNEDDESFGRAGTRRYVKAGEVGTKYLVDRLGDHRTFTNAVGSKVPPGTRGGLPESRSLAREWCTICASRYL